jgi:hypothetical protein
VGSLEVTWKLILLLVNKNLEIKEKRKENSEIKGVKKNYG